MRPARLSAALALLAAVALLATGGTRGQDKAKAGDAPPTPAAKGPVPKGFETLGLTDAQWAEVARLTAEHRQKVDQLREEIRKLDAEYGKKKVAVLTDDQRKNLIDLVAGPPPKDTDPKVRDKWPRRCATPTASGCWAPIAHPASGRAASWPARPETAT